MLTENWNICLKDLSIQRSGNDVNNARFEIKFKENWKIKNVSTLKENLSRIMNKSFSLNAKWYYYCFILYWVSFLKNNKFLHAGERVKACEPH